MRQCALGAAAAVAAARRAHAAAAPATFATSLVSATSCSSTPPSRDTDARPAAAGPLLMQRWAKQQQQQQHWRTHRAHAQPACGGGSRGLCTGTDMPAGGRTTTGTPSGVRNGSSTEGSSGSSGGGSTAPGAPPIGLSLESVLRPASHDDLWALLNGAHSDGGGEAEAAWLQGAVAALTDAELEGMTARKATARHGMARHG
ncbi:hypothetical protein FOA52_016262 [Chlamydomonas sp. UWO 241]|nr:hypothetical protein FOA52_016262 [Chlamydomonas sp. UWO 241]